MKPELKSTEEASRSLQRKHGRRTRCSELCSEQNREKLVGHPCLTDLKKASKSAERRILAELVQAQLGAMKTIPVFPCSSRPSALPSTDATALDDGQSPTRRTMSWQYFGVKAHVCCLPSINTTTLPWKRKF